MPRLVPPHLPAGTMAALEQPTIGDGPDVMLRPFEPDDASWVCAAFSDPEIQHWHRRRMDDRYEAEAWIAQWRTAWQAETDSGWAVTSGSTGEPLGRVGVRGVDLDDGRAEISYWMLPGGRRRGAATAAVGVASEWLFDVLGLRRVEIVHSVENRASCGVATRAGFALEGVMRSTLLHDDGWHDMHLHARISTDRWVRRRRGTAPPARRSAPPPR